MKTAKQYIKEAKKTSISKNFWYSSSDAEELKNILIELILKWEKERIPNADDEDVGYLKGLKKCADELARVTNLRR